MPLTVITLKKTTPSLRGDLSKWMQEIATGVYVGNFNSRIRERLWERVIENVGEGEATLSYAARNEIGYNFETYNTDQKVIDYEGIPLVIYPKSEKTKTEEELKLGFSHASKMRKQKIYTGRNKESCKTATTFIVLDIETDGLNVMQNSIIEIGALKVRGDDIQEFHKLIKRDTQLPKKIEELTGINDKLLETEGEEIRDVLQALTSFVGNEIIVGYNIGFDMKFINYALRSLDKVTLSNQTVDLQYLVKKDKVLLKNYKLQTVLKEYGIERKEAHRALNDAKATLALSKKVNKFQEVLKQEEDKLGDL